MGGGARSAKVAHRVVLPKTRSDVCPDNYIVQSARLNNFMGDLGIRKRDNVARASFDLEVVGGKVKVIHSWRNNRIIEKSRSHRSTTLFSSPSLSLSLFQSF